MTTIQPIPEQSGTVLRDLMQTLIDGREGFSMAADRLDDSGNTDIAATLRSFAEQRQRFAAELQEAASDYVTLSDVKGSAAADLHRAWMSLADAITGDDPHAVLAVAEQGEDEAKKAYEQALNEELPSDLRELVSRQAAEVNAAHDRVRDLRDDHAS